MIKSTSNQIVDDGAATEKTTEAPPTRGQLRVDSLAIKRGHLVAVVGAVGSGKSTLLNSLLGNVRMIKGSAAVAGSTAYAAQSPWVINKTLRENVTLATEYDETRFRRVVEQCAMAPDIALLPGGDMTEIGEKGINLSGGQKARLALARAVYQNYDVYLLDDPLAAVDVHVGRHLFQHVMLGLRDAGKTVILVTHQLQYLNQCDSVVVMQEGQVLAQGAFDNLSKRDDVRAFLQSTQQQALSSDDEEDEEQQEEKKGGEKNRKVGGDLVGEAGDAAATAKAAEAGAATTVEEGGGGAIGAGPPQVVAVAAVAAPARGAVEAAKKAAEAGKLTTKEDRVSGSVRCSTLSLWGHLMGAVIVLPLLVSIFLLGAVARMICDWWISKWTENAYAQTDVFYALLYLAGSVVVALTVFLAGFFYSKASLRASGRLHNRAFRTLLQAQMAYFDRTPIGRLINRFSADIDQVRRGGERGRRGKEEKKEMKRREHRALFCSVHCVVPCPA